MDDTPLGTYEDGVSTALTTRINKLTSVKRSNVFVVPVSELEQALSVVKSEISVLKESGIHAEVLTSTACGEGYKFYLFHNLSESTEQSVTIELPQEKHFVAVDCASSEVHEIDQVEHEGGVSRIKFCFSPLQTVFIASSPNKIPAISDPSRIKGVTVNQFSLPQRNYRIVFKDQWGFEPQSMNVLPLANWSVRIGLSRESGQFSHFYETTFEVKEIPERCVFFLSGLGHSSSNGHSIGHDVSVNGARMTREPYSDGSLGGICASAPEIPAEAALDCSLQKVFGNKVSYYDIARKIVPGYNRISIRTTGNAADPQPILYPPLVMGDFSVNKGTHGWALDKPSLVVGHDSWTRHGYPYLSGRATYSQLFDVPNEYEKLILRLSRVSGTVYIKLNEVKLGSYHWHPLEIDITSYCSASKRNELSIEVVNTMDNVLRMNGRPSGLTGEVYIDVY